MHFLYTINLFCVTYICIGRLVVRKCEIIYLAIEFIYNLLPAFIILLCISIYILSPQYLCVVYAFFRNTFFYAHFEYICRGITNDSRFDKNANTYIMTHQILRWGYMNKFRNHNSEGVFYLCVLYTVMYIVQLYITYIYSAKFNNFNSNLDDQCVLKPNIC